MAFPDESSAVSALRVQDTVLVFFLALLVNAAFAGVNPEAGPPPPPDGGEAADRRPINSIGLRRTHPPDPEEEPTSSLLLRLPIVDDAELNLRHYAINGGGGGPGGHILVVDGKEESNYPGRGVGLRAAVEAQYNREEEEDTVERRRRRRRNTKEGGRINNVRNFFHDKSLPSVPANRATTKDNTNGNHHVLARPPYLWETTTLAPSDWIRGNRQKTSSGVNEKRLSTRSVDKAMKAGIAEDGHSYDGDFDNNIPGLSSSEEELLLSESGLLMPDQTKAVTLETMATGLDVGEEELEVLVVTEPNEPGSGGSKDRADIVTKLLRTVESQALQGANCTPGTDMNLGHKVRAYLKGLVYAILNCLPSFFRLSTDSPRSASRWPQTSPSTGPTG